MKQKVLNIIVVGLLVGIVGVSSLTIVQQLSYQNLDSQYQELLTDYETLSSQYNEILGGDYNTLLGQYQLLVTEYDQLNSTHTVLLSTHCALMESLDETMQSLLDTTLELSALNITYWTLNELYVILEGQRNSLNATYYQLLSEHENLQADYNQLLLDFDALQTDYDALLLDYTQLQADFNALQSDYDSLWLNYDNLQSQYNQLQIDYNSLEQDYLNLQSEYVTLSTSYWVLQSEYDACYAELTQLQSDYNLLNTSYVQLQADYDSLNTTYWELWESVQPNYEIDVTHLAISKNTLYVGEYFVLNVTLEWIETQTPVTVGYVFVNGFQCYHLEDGIWSCNSTFTEMGRYSLDYVVYLDAGAYQVDVQDNGLTLDIVVMDHINLVMVQVTAFGVIGGGSTGFLFTCYGLWNSTGERVQTVGEGSLFDVVVNGTSEQNTTSYGLFTGTHYTEFFISMSKTVVYPTIYEYLYVEFYAKIYDGVMSSGTPIISYHLMHSGDYKMRWW